MRGIGKMVLMLGIALLLAGPTAAQDKDKKKGGRGGFGLAALVANDGVQKELKLSDEQIEKAKKAAQDVIGKFRDDLAKLKDATPEERAEFRQKVSDESYKALGDILKPEQTKRLKQIELQQVGLTDKTAQTALKLTDEQKEKVKKIAEETTQKRRELFKNAQGGDRKEAMEKMTALTKESHEKEAAVLTDEQKKQWKDMTGEPFQVKFESRSRRKSDT